MITKKLILHYEFMQNFLKDDPKTTKQLAEAMKKEFGVDYHYVYTEVQDLISLNKIKMVKYNTEMLLLWTNVELKFEHELSTNVVHIEKQFIEFNTKPSIVRQMKLPIFVLAKLKEKITDLSENLELMVALTAVKSNGVWYKIERR